MKNSHAGTEVGFSALRLSTEIDISKGNITPFFQTIFHKKNNNRRNRSGNDNYDLTDIICGH